MKRLAIGPETGSPSWEWVGLGTAGELRKYFEVVVFADFGAPPDADLVLVVKQRPPLNFVDAVRRRGGKVFFAPVDVYQAESEIAADREVLANCETVLLHSEALRPAIEPYCRTLATVEHHARFALGHLVPYKEEGVVLWIGAFEHVPHILEWLELHPLPAEIVLLTDLANRQSRIAGHFEAHRLGLSLRVDAGAINGYATEQWSEAAQAGLMGACKAAIDIKGSSFNQASKPPTKAQQFVASGIPFACNKGHPAASYFRARGFQLAEAGDFERLMSPAYWAETQSFARGWRHALSIEAVGQSYRSILAGPP
jgi:hypothetical protein